MWVLGSELWSLWLWSSALITEPPSGPRVCLVFFLQQSVGECPVMLPRAAAHGSYFWVEFCGLCEGSVSSVSPTSQLPGSVAPGLGLLPMMQQ